MIIYLDTGIFFDYLIERSHSESILRKNGRSKRDNEQLRNDVEECFKKFSGHTIITSCITFYETEDAMLKQLKNGEDNIDNRSKLILMSARTVLDQVSLVANMYNIRCIELTSDIFTGIVNNAVLKSNGVKLGDSIHAITAVNEKAELIITGDNHMKKLNEKLINSDGKRIRCLDTDEAKLVL